MPGKQQASCSLDVLLARDAPVGVILRRGPTDWVQMIRWQVDDDTFEEGQWFHGRVYERVSDLSPDGQLFVYMALKSKTRARRASDYTYRWTAISKPPYFTALALWPLGENGDDGGGYFVENRTVWLWQETARPHKDHRPSTLKVFHSDDRARFAERSRRDGWALVQPGQFRYELLQPTDPRYQGHGFIGVTDRPYIWRHEHPNGRYALVSERYREPDRKITSLRYIVDDALNRMLPIEDVTWVDWDQRGRLAFAHNGQMLVSDQFNAADVEGVTTLDARLLADFAANTPTRLAPPTWATRWPVSVKGDKRPALPTPEPMTTDYPL